MTSNLKATIDGRDITVEDAAGGVWRPSMAAAEAILAADDPERAACEMCEESPMRGEWKA